MRKHVNFIWFQVFILGILIPCSFAATWSEIPTDDAFVDSINKDSNQGGSLNLYVSYTSLDEITPWYQYGYIKFDLSSIPDSAVITAASLEIRLKDTVDTVYYQGYYNTLHYVEDDNWGEYTITWSNRPFIDMGEKPFESIFIPDEGDNYAGYIISWDLLNADPDDSVWNYGVDLLDDQLSLALLPEHPIPDPEYPPGTLFSNYDTREGLWGSEGPYLNITYQIVDPCEGGFDHDGDVDGSDLAVFIAEFGVCTIDCQGDFEPDGDVDEQDLALFAEDFGRTNCPTSP